MLEERMIDKREMKFVGISLYGSLEGGAGLRKTRLKLKEKVNKNFICQTIPDQDE